jgi:two-component system chemotaxis sensor kinase CheA
MQIDLTPFRRAFLDESAEHVAALEEGLLRLESQPEDTELLSSIFRAAHSVKGGAGSFGFEDVARFTHSVENLLDRMRNGLVRAERSLVDLLLRANDVLKCLLEAARAKEYGQPAAAPCDTRAIVAELQQRLGAPDAHAASAAPIAASAAESPKSTSLWRIEFAPHADFFRTGSDPLLLLRELAGLGRVASIEADLQAVPSWDAFEPEDCYLAWRLELESSATLAELNDVFLFSSDDARVLIQPGEAARDNAPVAEVSNASVEPTSAAAQGAAPPPTGTQRRSGAESASIRVSVEKVDQLINVIGELVIAQSMVADVVNNFSPERVGQLREAVLAVERNTRDLQERVMAVRMVPIGSIFSRFPRIVRDLAAQLGKEVRLELEGEETELDKGVVEKISDPLTHLIRNSLDHGVEPPDERERCGKPREGVVRLRALTEGGSVFVEIADDGAGLNTERIRAKALEKGLMRPDDNWSQEQIHQLIFQPAFSTAAKVSDVSGRGVGMDVVKKNVESLGGAVAIHSTRGEGARFRIKLPLTLAILDGLSLSVGGQIFILPLVSIVESFRPRASALKTLLSGGEVALVRGQALPLLRAHRLLGIEHAQTDPTKALLAIVESDGRRVALLVDELCGQSQVVIKNLDANFRRVEGVMGATIMGDGRVALILDVPGLIRLSEGASSTLALA